MGNKGEHKFRLSAAATAMKKADPKEPAFYSGTVVPISAVA